MRPADMPAVTFVRTHVIENHLSVVEEGEVTYRMRCSL